jgi:hypothetical protein
MALGGDVPYSFTTTMSNFLNKLGEGLKHARDEAIGALSQLRMRLSDTDHTAPYRYIEP